MPDQIRHDKRLEFSRIPRRPSRAVREAIADIKDPVLKMSPDGTRILYPETVDPSTGKPRAHLNALYIALVGIDRMVKILKDVVLSAVGKESGDRAMKTR